MITFGEDGLYWHLDHIGVHERTYTAVKSFGPWAPPLYYVTMQHGVMTELVQTAVANGLRLRANPFDIEPDVFGEHAKPPTLILDVHDWVPRKLSALWRHRTQVGADNPFRHHHRRAGRASCSASSNSGGRRSKPAGAPCSNNSAGASHTDAHEHFRHPALPVLRQPPRSGDLLVPRADGDEIHTGILGCQCCVFPVIDGIPVMHLQPNATAARELVEQRQPAEARRAMFGLEDVPAIAERVDALIASPDATYRQIVEAFGEHLEGGYFLYRFADPTFIVGHALVRAVGGSVLRDGGRAVDICGGSGHLTRSLMDLSSPAPVLADLYFAKVWLARRFTAPGCEPVCCDGNSPMPFARGAFRYAMCSDAFMYIWTKRQFVARPAPPHRRPNEGRAPGAAMISHTHNQCTWTPSHGQPLTPDGYRDLFETIEPRVFGESGLFADVVRGGPLDLSRVDGEKTLEGEQALAIVASRHPGVFAPHAARTAAGRAGRRIPRQPALRRRNRRRGRGRALPAAFPVRGLRAGIRRLPANICPTTCPSSRSDLRAARGRPRPVRTASELVRRRVVVDIPLTLRRIT